MHDELKELKQILNMSNAMLKRFQYSQQMNNRIDEYNEGFSDGIELVSDEWQEFITMLEKLVQKIEYQLSFDSTSPKSDNQLELPFD